MRRPVPGTIASGFGPRAGVGSANHLGIDFSWDGGWAIVAADDGVVSAVYNEPAGYGWLTIIDHGGGVTTRYAHQAKGSITVKVGERVTAGQKIGTIGNTGASFGAHLHFEVRVNGTPVDPEGYFTDSAATTSTPVPTEEKEETIMFVRIESPNRGQALVAPNYFRQLSGARDLEEIKAANQLPIKILVLTDARFDTIRDLVTTGGTTATVVEAGTFREITFTGKASSA